LQNGLNHLMKEHGVKGRFELDLQMGWADFLKQLQKGPIMTNVYKLSRLKGGHFINISGWEHGFFRVLDPFGDASTDYENQNGNNVFYDDLTVKQRMVDYQKKIFGKKAKENNVSVLYFKSFEV